MARVPLALRTPSETAFDFLEVGFAVGLRAVLWSAPFEVPLDVG